MNDPDVVLRVYPESDALSLIPAVRQRLGKRRIDFEAWRHDRAARLREGRLFEQMLRDAECRENGKERCACQKVPLHVSSPCVLLDGHELLHALPVMLLARIDVSLPIQRDAPHGEELSGIPSSAAK